MSAAGRGKVPLLVTAFLSFLLSLWAVLLLIAQRLPEDANASYSQLHGSFRAGGAGHGKAASPAGAAAPAPAAEESLHFVFSTSCSGYQHWQTELLYWSFKAVRQRGSLTRIVADCSDSEKERLLRRYATVAPDLQVCFAPASTMPGYKYFNKPFGLRHWLERFAGAPTADDAVVVLIDPDFIFLRPLEREDLGAAPGRPVGQAYGLGSRWLGFNRTHVCRHLDADCGTLTDPSVAVDSYAVGPPYVALRRDMLAIAGAWVQTAPRVHEEFPEMLAEMYGYCVAAASLNLRHERRTGLMVSDPTSTQAEGWAAVDAIDDALTCERGFSAKVIEGLSGAPPLPFFDHYCNAGGRMGDWIFSKHRVPHDVFSCDAPLLAEPPPSAARVAFGVNDRNVQHYSRVQRRRRAFMACFRIQAVNEAARAFKRRHCGAGANTEETVRLRNAQEAEVAASLFAAEKNAGLEGEEEGD